MFSVLLYIVLFTVGATSGYIIASFSTATKFMEIYNQGIKDGVKISTSQGSIISRSDDQLLVEHDNEYDTYKKVVT
jgi:hypothetical protein